jgi:hypothetical protein
MAVEELALYPADSLHISKTLNPFDISNTICLCVLLSGSIIGSYKRSWERLGDLPRVIEIVCLFASEA